MGKGRLNKVALPEHFSNPLRCQFWMWLYFKGKNYNYKSTDLLWITYLWGWTGFSPLLTARNTQVSAGLCLQISPAQHLADAPSSYHLYQRRALQKQWSNPEPTLTPNYLSPPLSHSHSPPTTQPKPLLCQPITRLHLPALQCSYTCTEETDQAWLPRLLPVTSDCPGHLLAVDQNKWFSAFL